MSSTSTWSEVLKSRFREVSLTLMKFDVLTFDVMEVDLPEQPSTSCLDPMEYTLPGTMVDSSYGCNVLRTTSLHYLTNG